MNIWRHLTGLVLATGILISFGGPAPVGAHQTADHHADKARIYVLELDRDALRAWPGGEAAEQQAAASVIKVIRARLAADGANGGLGEVSDTGGATVSRNAAGQIVITMPQGHSRAALLGVLGLGTKLEFGLVGEEAEPGTEPPNNLPPETRIISMPDGLPPAYVQIVEGIDERRLDTATAAIDKWTNEPVLNLQFDEEGARLFAALTAANVGKKIAIIRNGEVVSAPVVNEPITGGQVQVSGGFTQESANEMAIALAAGALPVAIEIVEERPVPE